MLLNIPMAPTSLASDEFQQQLGSFMFLSPDIDQANELYIWGQTACLQLKITEHRVLY